MFLAVIRTQQVRARQWANAYYPGKSDTKQHPHSTASADLEGFLQVGPEMSFVDKSWKYSGGTALARAIP